MKKIVLGCAAVLLSLGLLVGCNNKEDEPPITEAVSLSVSQTSVNLEPGGSASVTYTVDPAGATVMALSDHEEYVTAVAQEGTIYLEAVAAGSAIVSVGAEYEDYASAEAQITVTVAEVVEPGPVTPTVSLTLTKSTLSLVLPTDEEKESGETGAEVIKYEVVPTEEEGTDVVMEVTESTPTEAEETKAVVALQNLEDGWTATPQVPGTAEITVTATCEDYERAEATIAVTVYEAGTEPEEKVVSITVDNTATVVEGETTTLSYTVDPEGAEVVAKSDNEDIVTAEASNGVLSLEGVAAGATTVTLTGTYEDYTSASVSISVSVTTAETGTASNITLILNLYDQSDNEYVLPEWLDLYMYGSWMDDSNLSTESNAVKLTYHGDNDEYYGNYYSLTISGEIEFGTYEYHLFVVYNDGMNKDVISWSNNVYTGWFDINYAGDEYDYRLTWTVTDDLEEEYPDPNAVGTVEQQTNHKINFYFVSDSSHTTFYEIPSYADGYLCGYFTGSNWTQYTIGGNTKLTANGDAAEDGYSVTLDTVDTGSREVNIYFEFNSTAQNHTEPTDATWNADHSVFGGSNGHIIIDNTQGATESDVYIECNPSTIISDEADFCDLIVRVIDSGNSSKTLYISGINDWTAHTMTAVTGQTYQYEYEDASVDKGSSLEFGIYNDSTWGDSLKFATEVSGSYWNNGNDICFDGSHTNYDTTIITLTADCSVMGTSTTHASITNVTITH